MSSQPWHLASPSSFLLPPGLKLSVFEVRELRRAQPALHTVMVLGNPSFCVLTLKRGMGRRFSLFLEAGGLEHVEESLTTKRETDSRRW